MARGKQQPDYASGPGGAMTVSAQQQNTPSDKQPLLNSGTARSDAPSASRARSPPSGKGKSPPPPEKKNGGRSPARSPSPVSSRSERSGCCGRGCRCDKVCYLRLINYALDFLDGDVGDGLEGQVVKKPNRVRALCGCLCLLIFIIGGLVFSWPYIAGSVMAALASFASMLGDAGSYVAGLLPDSFDLSSLFNVSSVGDFFASLGGLFKAALLGALTYTEHSLSWFLNGGLLPHEAIVTHQQEPCGMWDKGCSQVVVSTREEVVVCPDGLIVPGGRSTPMLGLSTMCFLFWVSAPLPSLPSLPSLALLSSPSPPPLPPPPSPPCPSHPSSSSSPRHPCSFRCTLGRRCHPHPPPPRDGASAGR